MTAIGPGDWVERVALSAGGGVDGIYAAVGEVPKIGKIYRVRAVAGLVNHTGKPWDGLRLEGIKLRAPRYPDRDDLWMQVEAFRPIYRPREDLIATLLEPLPDTVLPVELAPTEHTHASRCEGTLVISGVGSGRKNPMFSQS